jgi:RHS repeat-associated protein
MIFLYRSGRRNGSLLFVNDGFGRRILKRGGVRSFCNNTPTGLVCGGPAAFEFVAYAYDQEGHLLGEYSMPNGNVLREYVWLGDMPVAVIDGSPANPTIYYVQTDHLNTPRAVLDRSGRQRWSWIVEPFGSGLPIEDPLGLGAFKLNLRMPGQYFDEQSGLIYNWHRIYDESIGRYTQPDPIGLSGGINTYAYVGGDPVSRVDPMGLAQCFYSISSGQMNCYSDFPSQTGFSGQFASGNNSIPGCKNNPACISESGVGPIPTGYWYWDPQGASGKPGGRVLVPIQVDAVRSNIRSHSCDNPLGPSKVGPFCSEGCLTGTVSTIGALNQFLGSEWAGGVSNTLRVGP